MVAAYVKMPEHVNVFTSGKIVLLGIKSVQRANDILNILYDILQLAFI